MEDLEINQLHKAFLTKFRREFEIACKKSYVIAIPTSKTLENYHIDQYFANSHILIPSKLLKMHYNPSQVGNFEDIEIDEKRLICTRSSNGTNSGPNERQTIRIIAQEIGYNMASKEYKVLLISEPLVSVHRQRTIALNLRRILEPLSARSPTQFSRKLRAHLINSRHLLDHNDCFKYLGLVSAELTCKLKKDVQRFQTNYIILAHYLTDAAERARQLAESYVERFELELDNSSGFDLCDAIRRSLRLAVENLTIFFLRNKLIDPIRVNYENEDKKLISNFDSISDSRLSICQLGAQEDFSNFSFDDNLLRLIKSLPSQQSPLAMLNCLMKLVQLISDNLNQSVRFKRMLGATPRVYKKTSGASLLTSGCSSTTEFSSLAPESPIPICSDDLIASFVFCISQARPRDLFSALKFLRLFGWSSIERDQASYYLATFELAVEYIIRFSTNR